MPSLVFLFYLNNLSQLNRYVNGLVQGVFSLNVPFNSNSTFTFYFLGTKPSPSLYLI